MNPADRDPSPPPSSGDGDTAPVPSSGAVQRAPAQATSGAPSSSEGDLAEVMEGLQRFKDRDPDESLEVPPPQQLPAGEGNEDPYLGTTFDHRYKIESKIGQGGMGVVYLARHKVIDKKVAVKVLRADMAKDREILTRFVQEARAASSIGNDHIIDISDFGDLPDGSTYFVMEFLEGIALSELAESNAARDDMPRVSRIAMQLADGLAAAHAAGIVHRDLKPENVFLVPRGTDKEYVKILDFGVAKVSNAGTTKMTQAGAVFGTPHYMSPEQAAGAPIDHRADIYALGVILYELVAGELPFNADNFMGILTQHMYKAPVPIRALVNGPDCPPGLEAIVLKCLSKKPEGRYQSMEELGEDLLRLNRGEVPNAVSEMMARSAGFNVPHDYFKVHSPKAMVPATPTGLRSRWPRYVWMAGAFAAIALVTAILIESSNTTAEPMAPTAAPSAPSPTLGARVVLAAIPNTAVAIIDGKEVRLPTSMEVEEGKPLEVEIRAEGYESQTLTLDGKETSKSISLEKIGGAAPTATASAETPPPVLRPPSGAGRPPAPPRPVTKKKASSGEIKEPWD